MAKKAKKSAGPKMAPVTDVGKTSAAAPPSGMPQLGMAPAPQLSVPGGDLMRQLNPVTNPTNLTPEHGASNDQAHRHFGAALGHLLIGNHAAAAQHFGAALGHVITPTANEQELGAHVAKGLHAAAHRHGRPAATTTQTRKEPAP